MRGAYYLRRSPALTVLGGGPRRWLNRNLRAGAPDTAPARTQPQQGTRTHQPPGRHPPIRPTGPPGPPPAPPGPSGGPASWARCLATPRSPPRPRGGENRAAGRVPPLIVRGAKKAMDSTDTTDIFWATWGDGAILVHPLGVTGGHFLIRLSENGHLRNRYAPEIFEHMARKISLRYVEIRGLFGFRCT